MVVKEVSSNIKNWNFRGRKLRTFTPMNSVFSYRSFLLLFFIAFATYSHSQTEGLNKFRVDQLGTDGMIYVFEGMKNQEGEVVIPANYDYIWEFEDTLTLARKRIDVGELDEGAFTYQIISVSGYLYYEFPDYLIPESISEGLIRTWNSRLGKFGYLSPRGIEVIKYQFDNALDFSESYAAVKRNNKSQWDFIDKSGKFISNKSFDDAYSFSEGYAVVKIGDSYKFFKVDGETIDISGEYLRVFDVKQGFSITTALENDSIKYGFVNTKGESVLDPRFDFIDNFEGETAVFVKDGEAGMISKSGEILINPIYDELYRFDQAHYLFQQNGLQGLIRIDGTLILPADYNAIGLFHEGLCAVRRGSLWGFANTAGEEVIDCRFSEIGQTFQDGKAKVHLPDEWILVKGQDSLILPAYDEVLPYYGYSAAFRIGNQWGFLNQYGEESIEPIYDELVFNKGSVVFGRSNSADGSFVWSVIDPYGKEAQHERYNEVVRYSDGFAAVRLNDSWGFINSLGAEIVAPKFDLVRNFSEGRAAVMLNGEWGFIGEKGREEIPIFTGTPNFEGEVGPEIKDTVNAIRESFPMFLMEVIGDFNNNCACSEDLTQENLNSETICVNKIGKLHPEIDCTPFTKVADVFVPEAELNPALKIIRIPGRWTVIDTNGKEIDN